MAESVGERRDFAVFFSSPALLELCRRSFPDYCKQVHQRPLYAHQLAWMRELENRRQRYTLIVAPPESLKSSTVRMYLEWSIGNHPDTCCLLVMNTAAQAQRQVMAVAETLERNPRYRAVFPWIVPNPKRGWSHEVLFVQRKNESKPDPTLYGTGIDGPYQGSHVDLLIVDDPSDQQDISSQATMEQQRQRLRGVLLDRLEEGGRLFAILTRWGEADLVRDFREIGFTVLEQPLEGRYPWGRLLCPELFDDERILRLKEAKGGSLYQLTYQCDPQAATGTMVKREWWRRYAQPPQLSGRPIHSWDISTGIRDGDFSAFGCWGRGEMGYYLGDAGRWRLTMDELLAKMNVLYQAQRPEWIVVEEAGVSIPIIQYLQRHSSLPIMPIKPGSRDKVARLRAVTALIEGGRVWLPSAAPWLQEYVDEMSSFPGGQYDDQVDQTTQALAYLDARGGGRITGGDRIEARVVRRP